MAISRKENPESKLPLVMNWATLFSLVLLRPDELLSTLVIVSAVIPNASASTSASTVIDMVAADTRLFSALAA